MDFEFLNLYLVILLHGTFLPWRLKQKYIVSPESFTSNILNFSNFMKGCSILRTANHLGFMLPHFEGPLSAIICFLVTKKSYIVCGDNCVAIAVDLRTHANK